MRTNVLAGLAIMTALAVSACSLPGGADEPSTPPQASAPASAGSGAPTATDPSPSGGTDQLGQPFVTRDSSRNGESFTMTLYPVRRTGTTSSVNLTLSSSGDEGFTVSTLLTDNNSESGDASASAADGIQLVDGKNAKLYLVASDGQGHCLCTQGLTGVVLKDGASSIISATFAAPPADVTTVDVVVPSFGTVKDVPVQ